jgi:hypothetical protein
LESGRHRSRFSTFWIKNLLIPYPIRGNTRKPTGKRLLGTLGAGKTSRMRVMFFTWITLITAGIVFYAVIGVSHH